MKKKHKSPLKLLKESILEFGIPKLITLMRRNEIKLKFLNSNTFNLIIFNNYQGFALNPNVFFVRGQEEEQEKININNLINNIENISDAIKLSESIEESCREILKTEQEIYNQIENLKKIQINSKFNSKILLLEMIDF